MARQSSRVGCWTTDGRGMSCHGMFGVKAAYLVLVYVIEAARLCSSKQPHTDGRILSNQVRSPRASTRPHRGYETYSEALPILQLPTNGLHLWLPVRQSAYGRKCLSSAVDPD